MYTKIARHTSGMRRTRNDWDVLLFILRHGLFGAVRLVRPAHIAGLAGLLMQGRLDDSTHPFVQKAFIRFHRNPHFLVM